MCPCGESRHRSSHRDFKHLSTRDFFQTCLCLIRLPLLIKTEGLAVQMQDSKLTIVQARNEVSLA